MSLLTVAMLALYGCTSLKFSGADAPYASPLPAASKMQTKKLALVLGGGGAKGMAHVGVLEELGNAGIVPDLIIGCSSGAIVGGLYAANPDINAIKTLILPGKQSDVIEVGMSGWPYSIYNQNKLADYLHKHIAHHDFADLKIPFIVTATNLEFGNLTIFATGDVLKPILASAALPGAFAPVKIHDQYFVDCAVADPVPVRVARDLGYETVVAVNIAEQLPDSSPNHLFGLVKRSAEIAYINQCRYSSEGADVVISFKFKNIGSFTDEHNYYLYEEGRTETKKVIALIKSKLRGYNAGHTK